MKLHLPKLLRVAVIAAITCVTIQPVMGADVILTASNICGPEDDETTDGEVEGTRYLDVYYKEGVAGKQEIDVSYNNYVWEGNLVVGDIIENNIVASQGDVNKVGGIKKNNSTWTLVAPDSDLTDFKFTNNFTVKGDLTVQGDGEIVLGGQPAEWDSKNKRYKNGSNYTGLEVTGKLAVTGGSLTATKIITNNLQVSGGTISTSTANCTSGNSYAPGAKQSYIKNSLTISGGSLSFGYTDNVQGIGGGGHRMTAFGSSASFVMTQTGGTMRVYGDMDMKSGITINQSACTMVLRDTIYMGGSGTTTINQSGDTSKLVLGRLETTGILAGSCVFDISQTGAGLIHLAYGSNFAKASTINLTQSGSGTINIGGGHDTSITGTLPSKGYALNSSPAEAINTFHNITQTDGSINIKKNGIVNAGVVSIGDVVTVYDGGILGSTYGDLEYSGKKWQTVAGTNAPVSVVSEGVLDMQEGSSYGVSFQKSAFAQVGEDTCAAVINGVDKLSKMVELDFSVIALDGADTTKLKNGFALFNMDKRLWSLKEAEWSHEGGKSYVDGTLVYDYWVELTSGGEVKEVFSDTSSYLQTGLKISGSDIILNATNTHSYGTIVDGGTNGITVTLRNASALGMGEVTTVGKCTFKGYSTYTSYKLPSTVKNTGTLTLATGKFSMDASTLESQEVEDAFFDINNQEAKEAEDGFFRKGGYIYTLFDNVGDNSSLVLTTDVKISMLGGSVTLPAGTYTDDVEVSTVGKVDMAAYYMNSENHSISVSAIQQKSNSSTTKVLMAEGTGTLTVDSDIEVDADGGTIAVAADKTVSGSIKEATVSGTTGDAASGIVTATLEGANILTGNLTVGGADVLSGATVTTTGATSLSTDVASGQAVELGEVISNSGALTLDGSYDVGTLADNSGVVIPAGYVAADGDVTADGNGFRRVEGYTVQVVDNDAANGATLTGGDDLKLKDGTLEGVLDEATGEVTFGAGVDYSTYRMVEAVEESAQAIIDASVGTSGPQVEKVAMTAGTLKADESIEVNAKGGTVKLQEETAGPVTVSGCLENTTVESAGGTISADITGTSSVAVTGDTTLSGTNSYSGRTVIDGAVLKLEDGSSVGDGAVELKNHGTFDMGGNALSNAIKVTGCTLRGAGSYTGDMEVHDELELGNPTTANKVTLLGGGSLTGSDLTVNELDVQTDGDASVGGSLTINDNGTITLNNGKVLSVGGSLTLAGATTLALNGEYGVGDKLLTGGSLEEGAITLLYNDSSVELERIGNSIVLVSKFKQDKADIAAQANWGIATASRAFVNTVRGQHSNTGCIADGRGTVWAAAFGAYNDLDGSDIDVKGAAVGVDAKVGSCSTVGIAFGYAEGEVSPTGLRDADQEGEYVALYGSHGLKKLSSTSCLSLDWVAAYGNTESEWNSLKWEQDSLQLNTRLNWNKKVTERLGMSVFGGLEYFATGSDTADGVKSGSIQNLRGEIGVGARYVAWGTPASQPVLDEKGATLAAARPGCEKLVLHGEIRYFNDMVRSNPVIRMNGASGGGENPGRQGMGIEAGATYRISERWSASANYSFNAMEDSVEHRANVGASYTF